MSKTIPHDPQRIKESFGRELEQPKELVNEIVECVTDYARANPGHAALVCVGVGFFLGWKLKPW